MQELFLRLLNISITAGWLVLALALIRLIIKRAPKALICAAWALVALRLMLPFTIESPVSLVPSSETVPVNIVYAETPEIHSGILEVNSVVNPIISEKFAPVSGTVSATDPTAAAENAESSAGSARPNRLFPVVLAASIVWLAGAAAMLTYAAVSGIRLGLIVREAVPDNGVYLLDGTVSPFIFGFFRPKIYLPSSIGETDRVFALAHEKAHIARGDHLTKPLAFLLLSVYWFNPLMWLAYLLFCRDIELACDEKVLGNEGCAARKEYSQALINCSAPRAAYVSPLAFGESNIKRRVSNVMSYKKPAFWVIILSLIVIAALAAAFLTSPVRGVSAGKYVDTGLYTLTRSVLAGHITLPETLSGQDHAIGCDFGVLDTEKHGRTVTVYGFAQAGVFAAAAKAPASSESAFQGSDTVFNIGSDFIVEVRPVSPDTPDGSIMIQAPSENTFSVPVSIEFRGSSYPFVLKAKRSNSSPTGWELVSFSVPGSGEDYEDDVKALFPARIADDLLLYEEGESGRIASRLYQSMQYLADDKLRDWLSVIGQKGRVRFVSHPASLDMFAAFTLEQKTDEGGKCTLESTAYEVITGKYTLSDDGVILDFGDDGKLVFRSEGSLYLFDLAASDMETAFLMDKTVFYPETWLATDNCAFDIRFGGSSSYPSGELWQLGRSTAVSDFALTLMLTGGNPFGSTGYVTSADGECIEINFNDCVLYSLGCTAAVPEGDYSFVDRDSDIAIRGVEKNGTEHFYTINFSLGSSSGQIRIYLEENGEPVADYEYYSGN